MAHTNFQHCTANEYKNIIYNQETHNKIKILFNNVELEDADEYCESFEVVSRVIPNGSKTFMLENLVSQEATLVLHNIDTSIIQDQVSISIGTLVSSNSLGDTYEYVPIGIYNLQEMPTTDNGKTTIKLRDNSVKLDFNYNAKPLIDEHGGTATKLQILQDICTKAGITCNVSSFIGSSDLIGIYDNTITGRQYVSYLAGSAGAIPIITRSGALDFKYLNNLSTIEIPIEIVEQYSNAENFKISRVVYEDAIRKYESGNETYDTLFLDSANPYISSQEQIASIYNIVNNFEINSFKTGRILGNPAIDSYDLIQITDYDGTIFKTFANNTLRYNGKMINTFASEISFERKKENVSLKSGATFKKWAKTEIDNANAQITMQAGQIEEIEQDLQNPTSIKEDKYFDIEDALDSPLIDFSLYGETQQDSTTGANLYYMNYNDTTNNWNGLTIKSTHIGYSISNQSTGTSAFTLTNRYINLPAGTYTMKLKKESSLKVGLSKTNYSSIVTINAGSLSKTFTLNEATNVCLTLGVTNGTTYNEENEIMIYSGTTDKPFEPYTNGASPNPDYPQPIHNVSGDNTIEICGKNLFNKDNSNIVYNVRLYANGNYGSDADTNGYYVSDYIRVKSNEDIAFSETMNYPKAVCLYDENKTPITRYQGSTITTINTGNAYYIRFGGKTSSIDNMQVEYGTSSSDYEAYQGNSQLISLGNIELCKISTYQDYIYPSNDRWFHHKEIGKVVLDGSESYTSMSAVDNNYMFYTSSKQIPIDNYSTNYKTNYFTTNTASSESSTIGSYVYNSTLRMRVPSTIATTKAEFTTWLSTHNTIVYYVLSTPTDTEITTDNYPVLLEQLNNLMTLPLYKNMTHITLTPNDLQPTMKIEYYRDTSINENFVSKEDMTKYYTKTETNAQIQITSGSIMSEVSRVEKKTDDNNVYIGSVETSVTNLQTDNRTLLTFKQNIEENGVSTLKNTLIQADINGLSITKGEDFKNLMTDRNQQISSHGKEIMFMGYDDEQQRNVARIDDIESKRATIGVHRCETTGTGSNKRTAWFYVGGGN